MMVARERYLVDEDGNRVAVVLDIEEYRRLIERLEELEDVRAYDEAKATDGEIIPFEQAVEEIERRK